MMRSASVVGCKPALCQNGGSCTTNDDGVVCACAKGYKGIRCEIGKSLS